MTPADYDKKIQKLSSYQTYCVIPIVVINVIPRGPAIDADHEARGTLFRVFVSVLAVLGFIGIEAYKWQLKKDKKAAQTAMVPPPVETVSPYPRS